MLFHQNFIFSRSTRAGRHFYDNHNGAPMYYVSYLISGELRLVSESETQQVRAGQVVYIPKGYRYQSFWSGEIIDFITFAFFDAGTKETLKTHPQVIEADGELVNLFLSVPVKRGGAVTYRSLSIFYTVLDRLSARIKQGDGRENRIIKQAKTYIAQNPRASVPEIAAACGISEPYLYVICRRAGVTPNGIKQQVLCEMAADLLTSTDLRVEEIAERLGFSSDTYFRKIFKKHVGYAPLTVRKNALM